MKNTKSHLIKEVINHSIAWEMNIEAGDRLIKINEHYINDVLDYHYLVNDEYLEIEIKKKNNEVWILEIDKEYNEDLGIIFEDDFMDKYRSCRNKCIFCFIDQMPLGMRDTLYFKDDDSRLSFLQGNYITLTNMSDEDIDRIILYKLSPINISIHTTDSELRCLMLNNRFAGEALSKIDKLYEAGITMNGQIVLCKGINDGEKLEESIRKLTEYIPHMQSLSVVPAGKTRYRNDLFELNDFKKEDAVRVIDTVHSWQELIYKEHGINYVHVSDEWYIMAGMEIPPEESYDGYLQLENGVGMVRLFEDEFEEEFNNLFGDNRVKDVSIATGVLIEPTISKLVKKLQQKYPNIIVRLYPIKNEFFGENITVSGLLTGRDIINQLKDEYLGDKLLLPNSLLKSGEDILLDDLSIKDIENALQVPIHIVQSNGKDFIESILFN